MKIVFIVFMLIGFYPCFAIAGDFHGYTCTKDCSGHKAGYLWAMKKNISKYEDCGGKSQSFLEGCYAWVKEHVVLPDLQDSEAMDTSGVVMDEEILE